MAEALHLGQQSLRLCRRSHTGARNRNFAGISRTWNRKTLLERLMKAAAKDHSAVSLNVRSTNTAVRLYARLGFEKVGGSDMVNRVGGASSNMVAQLRP